MRELSELDVPIIFNADRKPQPYPGRTVATREPRVAVSSRLTNSLPEIDRPKYMRAT